jgi:hypothetical protein
MNIRINHITLCVSFALSIAVALPSAKANLLIDPGFETNALGTTYDVLNNFSTDEGIWGVEAATISGVDGGVAPLQGAKMLRMVDDGLTATQGYQVTNVSSLAALIDGGSAIVNFNAWFNANVSAARAGVYVQFFSAADLNHEIGSMIGHDLTLDNSPSIWQNIACSGAIPAGTRWLASQVSYNDVSLAGHPGYVDTADLTVVPEPGSLLLLLSGLTALLFYTWRKQK